MDHRTFQQLAAGDTLEDLGALERLMFAVHARVCLPCRELRSELDTLAGDLSLMAPARRPPAALQASIMAAIGAGAAAAPVSYAAAGAEGIASGSPGIVRRWQLVSAFAAATAVVLAVVAVGLGLMTTQLEHQLAQSLAALDQANAHLEAQTAAVTVALDPAHVTAPLEVEPMAAGASAFVVYRPGTDDSYLMAMDLPPTPADHVYQLWFADASGVHALGTFPFDGEGTFVAPFGITLDGATATMITLERTGGARGTPGPQVLFGEL